MACRLEQLTFGFLEAVPPFSPGEGRKYFASLDRRQSTSNFACLVAGCHLTDYSSDGVSRLITGSAAPHIHLTTPRINYYAAATISHASKRTIPSSPLPMQIRNPKRTRTRFRHQQRTTMSSSSSPPRIEELSISSPTPPDLSDVYPFNPSNRYIPPPMAPRTPSLFSSLPVLRDLYSTPTQIEQDSVVSRILPLLSSPLPRLKRQEHIEFLEGAFEEKLPDYMTVLDASRPWIVYWCITGLSLLGVDVSVYRERQVLLPAGSAAAAC